MDDEESTCLGSETPPELTDEEEALLSELVIFREIFDYTRNSKLGTEIVSVTNKNDGHPQTVYFCRLSDLKKKNANFVHRLNNGTEPVFICRFEHHAVGDWYDGRPDTLQTFEEKAATQIINHSAVPHTKVLYFSCMYQLLWFVADLVRVKIPENASYAGEFTITPDSTTWRDAFINLETIIVDLPGFEDLRDEEEGLWYDWNANLIPMLNMATTAANEPFKRFFIDSEFYTPQGVDYNGEEDCHTTIKYAGELPIRKAIMNALKTRYPKLRTFAYLTSFCAWIRPLHRENITQPGAIWLRGPPFVYGEHKHANVFDEIFHGTELDPATLRKSHSAALGDKLKQEWTVHGLVAAEAEHSTASCKKM